MNIIDAYRNAIAAASFSGPGGGAGALNIIDAYRNAIAADEAFSNAVHAAGFKSRWEMPDDVFVSHPAIRDAYDAKVIADILFHKCSIKERA